MPRHDIRVNKAANMTSPSGDVRQPGGILNTLLSSRWWDTKQAYIAIAVGTNRSCTAVIVSALTQNKCVSASKSHVEAGSHPCDGCLLHAQQDCICILKTQGVPSFADCVITFCSSNLWQQTSVRRKTDCMHKLRRYVPTPIQAASSVRLSTPVTCLGSRSDASSVAVSIIMSPQIILLSSFVLCGVAA